MGDGEGADGDVADLEGLAGLEVLRRREAGGILWRGCGSAWLRYRVSAASGLAIASTSSGDRSLFDSCRFGFSLAGGGLLAALLEPLGVGHLAARREPAHPGAVRGLGEVDGDAELARGDGEAVDVVGVLVGDDDGVEGVGLFAGLVHAAEELAAAEAGVDAGCGYVPPVTTVLLPLEPEASTVKRTMK